MTVRQAAHVDPVAQKEHGFSNFSDSRALLRRGVIQREGCSDSNDQPAVQSEPIEPTQVVVRPTFGPHFSSMFGFNSWQNEM